jgi:glycerol-3-phosphate acyltransferase PlsY
VAWNLEKPILFTLSLMSLLLIFRHAENIGRLARGTESKIGKKKPTP